MALNPFCDETLHNTSSLLGWYVLYNTMFRAVSCKCEYNDYEKLKEINFLCVNA